MKELSVVSFYKNLLDVLDLHTKEDGQLFTKLSDKETPLLIGGLPTYLPTPDNIKTIYTIVDGVSKKQKELFNPLSENTASGANKTFMKFRNILEYKMLNVFYYMGEALLLISMSKEEINDLNIVKFTSLLSRYKGGAKQLIDDKTLELWLKTYQNILNKYNNKKFINLLVRKGGLIDNIHYNRVGVITFPLGELILKLDNKDRILLDNKLRLKDIEVFKTIYEFLIGDDEVIEDGFMIGSLNKKSPSLHTLLLMYDKLYKLFTPVIESILNIGVDEDMAKMLNLKKLPFDVANLSSIIDGYETDVIKIPNDLSKPSDPIDYSLPNTSNAFNTNSGNTTVVNEEPSIANNFNLGKQPVNKIVSSPFGEINLGINQNQQQYIPNQQFNNGISMNQQQPQYYQPQQQQPQYYQPQQQFNQQGFNANNNINNNNQAFTMRQQQNTRPVIVNQYKAANGAAKSRYSI